MPGIKASIKNKLRAAGVSHVVVNKNKLKLDSASTKELIKIAAKKNLI